MIGKDKIDLGVSHTVEYEIDVQGSTSIKQLYRHFAPPMQARIKIELEKLLGQGIIEPSMSPWASPLVPVQKKNGKLCICVDFRAINNITKKYLFPLPCIANAVNHFSSSKYISSLDLLSGYHQIPLSAASKEITAFSTGDELYLYMGLHFRLTNAPAAFSQLISIVMGGISLDKSQIYLDNILIAGFDFDYRFRNLNEVLNRLTTHGLKLNASKCALFHEKVDYFSHEISTEGIRLLQTNIQTILEFPLPKTVKQL